MNFKYCILFDGCQVTAVTSFHCYNTQKFANVNSIK
jgi:hypothetical protein